MTKARQTTRRRKRVSAGSAAYRPLVDVQIFGSDEVLVGMFREVVERLFEMVDDGTLDHFVSQLPSGHDWSLDVVPVDLVSGLDAGIASGEKFDA